MGGRTEGADEWHFLGSATELQGRREERKKRNDSGFKPGHLGKVNK